MLSVSRDAFHGLIEREPALREAAQRLRLWGLFQRLRCGWRRGLAEAQKLSRAKEDSNYALRA